MKIERTKIMNINLKDKTVTCECGMTFEISLNVIKFCNECGIYHFECSRCALVEDISFPFLDPILKILDSSQDKNLNSNDIDDIFFGNNQIPITDALIEDLVKKGWAKDDLKMLQKAGHYRYSTARDSIIDINLESS